MKKTVLTICVVGLAAVTLLGGCNRRGNESGAAGPDSADAGPTAAMEFLKENKLLGKPVHHHLLAYLTLEFGLCCTDLSGVPARLALKQRQTLREPLLCVDFVKFWVQHILKSLHIGVNFLLLKLLHVRLADATAYPRPELLQALS